MALPLTTLFVAVNHLAQGTIKNGTGGPPRLEDALFPMENALDRDRYRVWKIPANTTAPYLPSVGTYGVGTVDINSAGSSGGFDMVGMLGLEDPQSGLQEVFVEQQNSGSYAVGGTWFSVPLPSPVIGNWGTTRNLFWYLGTPATSYVTVRIKLTINPVSAPITIGTLFAGKSTNLGLLYAPGTRWANEPVRVVSRTLSGVPFYDVVLRPRKRFSLNFDRVSVTTQLAIDELAVLGSFIYVDGPSGNVYEVVLTDGQIQWTHVWNNLYSTVLDMEQLP